MRISFNRKVSSWGRKSIANLVIPLFANTPTNAIAKVIGSDLSDAEWEILAPYLQLSERRGSGGKHDQRTIVNAILDVLKGGIEWRMLPLDFPPWQTVYYHFRQGQQKGLWQ